MRGDHGGTPDLPNRGRVTLVEVGPRDGLQNEAAVLPASRKAEFVRRVVTAGAHRVEVASFVHPDRVPQMADAEAVIDDLGPSPEGVSYIGLVLNRRGLQRAMDTDIDELNFVVGASEGFNRANAGVSPNATMTEIESLIGEVGDRSTTVTISVAFGCPYDGPVPVNAVVDLAARAAAAGADEIAVGDTIGVAVPSQIVPLVDGIRSVTRVPLRMHFHDTRNTATANAVAAVAAGVGVFDASVGGAGGCPFAPNATGNAATEDLVYLFERMGYSTGIDHERMIETAHWLGDTLGKDLPSALSRAGWWPLRSP